MTIRKQTIFSVAIIVLFSFFSIMPALAADGSCLCSIQDLTKKDSTPLFKTISQVGAAAGCTDAEVQKIYGENTQVAGCTWKTAASQQVAEKAEAVCSCLNKQTGAKTEKKQDVNFSYPLGTGEVQKGVFFAVEGQKYCSSISTSQQSCVFIDTVYGGGNIAAAETKISAYAKELNFLGTTDIRVAMGKAINVIMGIAGSLAFVMFIYGGFLYMISQGDSGKVEQGKKTMVWAAMGVAIIFASYTIISFIFEAVT